MKKKAILSIITLLPVIAIMVAIFLFSMQTGEESAALSGGITDIVVKITHPEFETLSSAEQNDIFESAHYYVRKVAHFLEYAALGFFLALHVFVICNKRKICIFISVPFCIIYASMDELHQGMVDGRGPAVFDVMIDSLGSITGILVMLLLITIVIKRRNHNEITF